jgi:hypothetical protein
MPAPAKTGAGLAVAPRRRLTKLGSVLYYFRYDGNHQEESLKSRFVVWTLVGVLVIIGVVVIATAPKPMRGPKVTLDTVKSGAAQAETQLDRLVVRVAEARKAAAPGAAPSKGLEEADRLLAQAREKLGQVRQATDLKQGQLLLVDGRQMLRRARRAVEVATRTGSRPRGM